ncbi:TATA element modulatory factor 1 TATA binding-domain-containing protein [Aspergillus ambiguus]|uniref:M protein repeat protein n=1 Tax=Aspergillus ambiguus TaxID=176160 RepID=UPI003CCE3342
MAQTPQGSKPKWKVGSFLQQAVAGVESRLDLILAEEEDRSQLPSRPASANASQTGNLSRSSSNARKNDRLQERLARAVVKSNTAPNVATPSPSSRVSSPVTSPVPSNDARGSMDIESSVGSPTGNAATRTDSPAQLDEPLPTSMTNSRTSHDSGISSHDLKETAVSGAPSQGVDLPQQPDEPSSGEPQVSLESQSSAQNPEDASASAQNDFTEQEKTIAQMQAEFQAAESHWQGEMHIYIERIDALQSKLKYLAKEAAESAKNAAAVAEPASTEKQLREKDEKIALLLQEGQQLSKSEMEHRMAIKRLRQQLTDNSKAQVENKKKTDRLERDLINAETRAKRAEAAEKRANNSLSAQMKASRDFEAVTSERNSLNQTVQELKSQLSRAVARAEAAEAKAQSDALEKEKHRATQLEEELANAKMERDVNEEKLRKEVNDLKDAVGQEKERARLLEVELKGEQSVLESKLESLRFKAEEASSGAVGESQAKLLRQIETLQTQYAVASENWQTLEGSLLSRLANVEKERDEAARREAELRRKLREANLKSKRAEEDLEAAKETEQDLQAKLEERMQELQKLEQKLKKASDDLDSAQKDFTEQKKVSDLTWTQKLEEERAKWREQIASPSNFLQQPRTGSPVAFSRRPSNLDPVASLSDYRPSSRRSSTLPMTSPEIGTPSRQNSFPTSTHAVLSPPVTNSASRPHVTDTPSITFEPDEIFSGSRTPSASGGALSQPSRGINDIISESTVGAGPSVQLVERMSATVRRLESERAATKDELARITAQRDEARQQVVDLMRESEEKKTSDARIQELEQQLEALDQRYQTTLEMLGEKSERVEELQADIVDIKQMYRELADRTMR